MSKYQNRYVATDDVALIYEEYNKKIDSASK
jgi:hypothetical protein